jgi:hypothetical protein
MCDLWIGVHKSALSGATFSSPGALTTLQSFSTVGLFNSLPLFAMIMTVNGSTALVQLDNANGSSCGSTVVQPGNLQLVRIDNVGLVGNTIYSIRVQTNESGTVQCWEYNLGRFCAASFQ